VPTPSGDLLVQTNTIEFNNWPLELKPKLPGVEVQRI